MVEEHDEFCHCRGILGVHGACCDCALIAKVRDHQRGFDIRQQVEERDAFRAKVEALYGQGHPNGAWVRRADVLAILDGANDDA